jgi:hypothetical protein
MNFDLAFDEIASAMATAGYDQSQAFSIRPDMNILTLELSEENRVSRQAEQRYEN